MPSECPGESRLWRRPSQPYWPLLVSLEIRNHFARGAIDGDPPECSSAVEHDVVGMNLRGSRHAGDAGRDRRGTLRPFGRVNGLFERHRGRGLLAQFSPLLVLEHPLRTICELRDLLGGQLETSELDLAVL